LRYILLLSIILLSFCVTGFIPDDDIKETPLEKVTEKLSENVVSTGYEFIRTDDSLFYSSHLLYYGENGKPANYFLVNLPSGEKYYSTPGDFILSGRMGMCYPLMNFDYSFLTFKDNVSRFLHPNFAIKFLYLIDKVGATQTISDAMRKSDEQLLYKRRGWTDVESSPHMYGLAADLVYYSGSDRSLIQSKTGALDVRFLEHGSRGNLHIHLQDNEIWKHVKPVFDTMDCKVLNDSLSNKSIPTEKRLPVTARNRMYDGYKKYSFTAPETGILKMVFLDKFGNTAGEIRIGVFEPGKHDVFYNNDFLKEGAYSMRVFYNYNFVSAVPVFKG
jgi:hypothetical protein